MNIIACLADYIMKDGQKSIYIITHVHRKRIRFFTGIKCIPEKWDPDNEKIKGSSKKVNDDNLVIHNCKAILSEIFVRYRLQNRLNELTPALLKKEYENPSLSIDFYTFMSRMIEERKNEITESSKEQHYATLHKLQKFTDKLFFSEINVLFIEKFSRYLKVTLKNKPSTIYNTLKNFRTYINLARRRGIIKKSPFDEIRIKRMKTDPECLTENELALLWKKYKSNFLTGTYQEVLRAFLFCCFTGLRISDVRRVNYDWIIGNTLIFQPYKTKNITPKTIKIPLADKALELINYKGSSTGLLFKIFSEQRMRTYIKQIIGHCGIKKELSWHSSRHTFASLFLEKTNDVATLQKLLGHSNIQQTMIYVHLNENKKIEQVKKFNDLLNL